MSKQNNHGGSKNSNGIGRQNSHISSGPKKIPQFSRIQGDRRVVYSGMGTFPQMAGCEYLITILSLARGVGDSLEPFRAADGATHHVWVMYRPMARPPVAFTSLFSAQFAFPSLVEVGDPSTAYKTPDWVAAKVGEYLPVAVMESSYFDFRFLRVQPGRRDVLGIPRDRDEKFLERDRLVWWGNRVEWCLEQIRQL